MMFNISEDGVLTFGNPKRRKNKPSVYQIIKVNYNDKTGDVYNTYCVQRTFGKTLDYFVEVCSKDGEESLIFPSHFGKKNFSMRDCRVIIKNLIENS